MQIRKATQKDLPTMRTIFDYGRQVQIKSGNFNQWEAGYPAEDLILEDIRQNAAHVCIDEQGEIIGVFSVFTEPDPTYEKIEGAWLNDEPYVTIHRIATNGKIRGTGQCCIEWVQNRFSNVRVDTHDDNGQMKHILQKLGFQYCGVIYLADGNARNAYQYLKKTKTK